MNKFNLTHGNFTCKFGLPSMKYPNFQMDEDELFLTAELIRTADSRVKQYMPRLISGPPPPLTNEHLIILQHVRRLLDERALRPTDVAIVMWRSLSAAATQKRSAVAERREWSDGAFVTAGEWLCKATLLTLFSPIALLRSRLIGTFKYLRL